MLFNPEKFKIRCSAIGQIMAEPKAVAQPKPYTATELKKAEKDGLILPPIEPIILTPEQKVSAGTKTFLEHWRKEQIYGKSKAFGVGSKYTKKGVLQEYEAINFLIEEGVVGYTEKNEERFANDFLIGTPDLKYPNKSLVVDIKCSWDCFTFPDLETELNPLYDWQVQGYMELLQYKSAKVIYCLMDAPELIIEQQAYLYARSQDSEDTQELYDEVKEHLTYSHFPPELRIKVFDVEYDPEKVARIKQRVNDCRAYLKTLIK
jgi:hypothetical protein